MKQRSNLSQSDHRAASFLQHQSWPAVINLGYHDASERGRAAAALMSMHLANREAHRLPKRVYRLAKSILETFIPSGHSNAESTELVKRHPSNL